LETAVKSAISVARGILLLAALATCGGGDGAVTRGSQCLALLQVYCTRESECGAIPAAEVSTCVEAWLPSCCAGDCGAGVVSTQSDIDGCAADFKDATCAMLDVGNGGTVPPGCVNVVK
jgi:hypothetical protein